MRNINYVFFLSTQDEIDQNILNLFLLFFGIIIYDSAFCDIIETTICSLSKTCLFLHVGIHIIHILARVKFILSIRYALSLYIRIYVQ